VNAGKDWEILNESLILRRENANDEESHTIVGFRSDINRMRSIQKNQQYRMY
jgi:hypothetical protein